MNLQLVYRYILGPSKNENKFYNKKQSKTNQNDQKRREKKIFSGGSPNPDLRCVRSPRYLLRHDN